LRKIFFKKYPGKIIYYKAGVRKRIQPDSSNGWKEFANSIDVQTITGIHIGLLKEHYAGNLARKIKEELRRLHG
jgi:thioesterase domain-containing protein